MLFDGGMQHSVNFYSSLFNQGPNSPKFHGNPPHFCVHISPQCLFTQYYHVTAQFFTSKLSTWELQVQHLFALQSVLVFFMFFYFIYFRNVNYTCVYLCTFLSPLQTANQKAAPRAGRLSGEGGDPDVSAGCKCEFVYFAVKTAGSFAW